VQQQNDTADRLVARIAGRSHGVVSRAQLLSAGVTPEQIRQRLQKGTLLQAHRGVYRVGHDAPSILATYMAAVRACGDGALLRGHAAAHLLGLTRSPPSKPEVLVPHNRRIEGITITRTRHLDPRDATTWRGIPVASVAKTVVDLATDLPGHELARVVHEAQVKHDLMPHHAEAVLARRPNAPGAATLRAILHGDIPVSISALERRFNALVDEAGLPMPVMNRHAGTKRVDARWPQHHLTVELDSYRFHNSRHSWEQDRRRDREARARGDELQRYTWDDVVIDPRAMMRTLTNRLTASARASGR
jgi:hypothetical protein